MPPGGILGWDKYDKWTNKGFPPGTCGGCGADDHFRNDCPENQSKGKHPSRKGAPKGGQGGGKAMGKGKGKDKWAKGVDDEEAAGEEAQADDGQQQDEGGSVWEEDDADCAIVGGREMMNMMMTYPCSLTPATSP